MLWYGNNTMRGLQRSLVDSRSSCRTCQAAEIDDKLTQKRNLDFDPCALEFTVHSGHDQINTKQLNDYFALKIER